MKLNAIHFGILRPPSPPRAHAPLGAFEITRASIGEKSPPLAPTVLDHRVTTGPDPRHTEAASGAGRREGTLLIAVHESRLGTDANVWKRSCRFCHLMGEILFIPVVVLLRHNCAGRSIRQPFEIQSETSSCRARMPKQPQETPYVHECPPNTNPYMQMPKDALSSIRVPCPSPITKRPRGSVEKKVRERNEIKSVPPLMSL